MNARSMLVLQVAKKLAQEDGRDFARLSTWAQDRYFKDASELIDEDERRSTHAKENGK